MMDRPKPPLLPQEGPTTDGYVSAKAQLRKIRFLISETELLARIAGPEAAHYASYAEFIRNGQYPNGLPIVYRTPKGTLYASDLRHSELVFYIWKTVAAHPSVRRDPIDPKLDVKIIDVDGVEDIARARAHYMGTWA